MGQFGLEFNPANWHVTAWPIDDVAAAARERGPAVLIVLPRKSRQFMIYPTCYLDNCNRLKATLSFGQEDARIPFNPVAIAR
jgi:hypothetical protein